MTSTHLVPPPTPVEALLALQAHDAALHTLETRAAAIADRRASLAAEREALLTQAAKARAAADTEQKRHREISLRLAAARVDLTKRQAAQDAAERLAEVTAAVARVEEGRRAVAMLEVESASSRKRTTENATKAQQLEARAAAASEAHLVAEASLSVEADQVLRELQPAREVRAGLAARVAPDVLGSYDRVRRRRPSDAVVALRGTACSACDTAMPLQRKLVMKAEGRIEVCEGCGVLLFAPA